MAPPALSGVAAGHAAATRASSSCCRSAGLLRPTKLATQLLLLAEGALITAAIDGNANIPRRAKAAAAVLIDSAKVSHD